MTDSRNFMMIFRFEPDFEYQPTQEERDTQHRQWGKFIGDIAIQEKLVSTHRLGFEGRQIAPDQAVTTGIHLSGGLTIGGNMIVRAKSLDEAVEMAKACPILSVGGRVEVRDINQE
ncbi:MAG: hypothetical protein MI921_09340 [Cytophagales bacterium]|nr:hypothetical protein [Cytophagales bacterium]